MYAVIRKVAYKNFVKSGFLIFISESLNCLGIYLLDAITKYLTDLDSGVYILDFKLIILLLTLPLIFFGKTIFAGLY